MDQNHESMGMGSAVSADITKFTTAASAVSAPLDSAPPISFLSKTPASGDLSKVLKRPVRIYTASWGTTWTDTHIDPWALFLNDTFVSSKIDKYKYLRGTLHLDIQVNGSPFHFGRLMFSYEPVNGLRTSVDGNILQHSQLPHVLVDPSSNTVGKICCPFVSPDLWMDLTDADGVRVGVLNLDEIAPLRVFQGGVPTNVTVQIYAWMCDVELAFPTPIGKATFTPQADEYTENPNQGLISGPAAMLANVATRLSDIPVIGRFATATAIGASAMGSIAKLFGYSSPKDLSADGVMLKKPALDMVVTDKADQVVPFTVNSKSELTIDPGVTGYSEDSDELNIASIANRWALAEVIPWNIDETPGTGLFGEAISPAFGYDGPQAFNVVNFTPMYYAAIPFSNWYGTIELKIQIVCSRYHRGRLRFNWNPEPAASPELNNSYNHIVDISDGQEYILKFPYIGKQGYKIVHPPSLIHTYDDSTATGVFNIYVQNELSGETNEPVSILIWARAGSDIRYTNPDDLYYSTYGLAPLPGAPAAAPPPPENLVTATREPHETIKVGDVEPQSATTELGKASERETEVITFYESSMHPEYDLAYYGDPVVSFRTLLKRYNYNFSFGSGLLGANSYFHNSITFPMYPIPPGFYPDGSWYDTANTSNFNNTSGTLMNYLSFPFLIKKGSCRVLVDMGMTKTQGTSITNLILKRLPTPAGADSKIADSQQSIAAEMGDTTYSNVGLGVSVVGGYPRRNGSRTVTGGAQLYTPEPGNMVASGEFPFYSQLRYVTHMNSGFDATDPLLRGPGNKVCLSYGVNVGTVNARPVGDVYYAAGEDFTCNFWVGVPPMTFNGPPPTGNIQAGFV